MLRRLCVSESIPNSHCANWVIQISALMRQRVCVSALLIEATLHHKISEITHRELFQSNLPCSRGQCSPLAVKRPENSFFTQLQKSSVRAYSAAISRSYFHDSAITNYRSCAPWHLPMSFGPTGIGYPQRHLLGPCLTRLIYELYSPLVGQTYPTEGRLRYATKKG